MSIIVGGGTGFIGQYFAKLARKRGFKVISVSRQAGPNCITWSDVMSNGLPEDCIAVVSMSGEKIVQPFKRWTPEMRAKLRESRIDKTQILNTAICKAVKPPKAFVVLTAIAAYKPDVEREYTEEDVIPPYDFPSEMIKDWEAAAKLPERISTRSIVIRTGLVIGRGGGVIQSMGTPFKLGLGGRMGSGQQWFSWIHAEDMAGIIMHAIDTDIVSGILNGTAPQPVRCEEFTKSFATALGRPHIFPTPEFVVRMIFGTDEAKIVLEAQKVVPKRTQELGYIFKYTDVKSALEEIVNH